LHLIFRAGGGWVQGWSGVERRGALLLRAVDGQISLGATGRLFSRWSLTVGWWCTVFPRCRRIYRLALGYEDLCDHEQLRSDPLLDLLRGKRSGSWRNRWRARAC